MGKKILFTALALLLIAVLLIVILYWRTTIVSDLIRNVINDNFSQVAHIDYSSLKGNLFQTIFITDLQVELNNGTFIYSNSLKIRYNLFSTLSGKYDFKSITLDSLRIRLPAQVDTVVVDNSKTGQTYEEIITNFASSADLDSVLKKLPEINIGNLKVLHGRVEYPAAHLTLDSLTLEVSARINSEGLDFRLFQFSGKWLERGFTWYNLSGELSARLDRITLNKLQVQTPYSRALGRMDITVTDTLALILSLEEVYLDYKDMNAFLNQQKLDSGYLQMSCQIVGSPRHFTGTLSAVGKANRYFLDTFLLEGKYRNGEVTINNSKLVANRSALEFEGALRKVDSYINLRFNHFDLQNFMPDNIHTDLSGSLYLDLQKLNLKNISGRAEVLLYNSVIDSFSFDSLYLAARAQNNNFTLLDKSFLQVGPDSKFSVMGTLSREKILDLNLKTENNSIAALAKAVQIRNVSGQFDANIFIRGELSNPDLEGYLWIPGITYGNWYVDTLLLETNIDHLFRNRTGSATVTVNRINSDFLDFTETRADLIFRGKEILLDTLLFANGQNHLSTSGFFNFETDTFRLGFDFFRIFYENYWIENNGPLLFSYDQRDFSVDRAVFSAPEQGMIEIRGFYEKSESDLQIGIYLENIQAHPFQQFFKADISLGGVLAGDFQIIHPLTDPRLDITLNGKGLKLNRLPIGDVTGTFIYENSKFYVDQFKIIQDGSEIDIRGDIAVQVNSGESSVDDDLMSRSRANLSIQWENISLESYSRIFRFPRPLKGYLSGFWNISGSLKNPSGTMWFTAHDLNYDKFASDSLFLQADFTHDLITLKDLKFDLNGTSLEGSGWQEVNLDLTRPDSLVGQRPFVLNLKSNDDHLEFIGFLNDQVESLNGEYQAEITITGTPLKPILANGFFKMESGQLELSRVKNPITRVAIDAAIENSLMTIKSFSGYSEKEKDFWESMYDYLRKGLSLFGVQYRPAGIVKGKGTLLFDNLLHPKLDIYTDLSRFYIDYFIENTSFVITANKLHLTGRDTLNVAGNVLIEEGNYLVDLDKLQKNIYLETSNRKPERTMSWNLDIMMPGNFKIRNSKLSLVNDFELEIAGELRSILEPLSISQELSGHLETLSGKYTAWGQNFVIRNGTINFTNPKVVNPDFDIRAEKLNRGYTYELSITGNLEKQNLDLQVKDELGNYLDYTLADKITLLSLGTTARGLSAGDMASMGKDVFSTSVESALGRGAELVTGLDKVEVSLTGNSSDPQAFKLNQGVKNASFAVGKYFTSNLYLEYQSEFGQGLIPTPKLSWEPGNRIGLTYRIANKWSIDSFYAQTQRGNDQIKISLSWKTTF